MESEGLNNRKCFKHVYFLLHSGAFIYMFMLFDSKKKKLIPACHPVKSAI